MESIAGVVQMLRNEHDRLARDMSAIGQALSAFGVTFGKQARKRGKISAGGRARIAAAQRARWAKVKTNTGKSNLVAMPKKRTMSAAGRKRIAAAQRARWAKLKAGKKSA
jgi:hypothetical protein